MHGFRFSEFTPSTNKSQNSFDKLHSIFRQLILMTSGDVAEALSWLTSLDKQYGLTDDKYGVGDFVQEMKDKGYLKEEQANGTLTLTSRSEQEMRKGALEEIFGKLKKSRKGNHTISKPGQGDENSAEKRSFQYGDNADQISVTDSIRNAQINHGLDDFHLTEQDLEIEQREHKAQTSTVLMIDVSHSMILYGEDRITPAKKVAMALAELITTKYPKDTLDILAFGDDAWQIEVKDLPYLQVGPYHTNTIAGLELALDILRRRKNTNKQIFMITDGKPTCMKVGIKYYKNSFGLDRKIISKTLNLAMQCRRSNIPITTFMIATDPYLKAFVKEFTKVNNGSAYYSSLQGLGHLLFEDFRRNRKKAI